MTQLLPTPCSLGPARAAAVKFPTTSGIPPKNIRISFDEFFFAMIRSPLSKVSSLNPVLHSHWNTTVRSKKSSATPLVLLVYVRLRPRINAPIRSLLLPTRNGP